MHRIASVILFLLTISAAPVSAADLEISNAWARPSGGPNGAAYLTMVNKGADDDRLVGTKSDAARKVELHTHIMEGDIVRMRPIDGISVAAGGRARLQPGRDHIMLFGLKGKLQEGGTVPITLIFERAGRIVVSVAIRKPTQADFDE